MLELTPFAALLAAAGNLYILLALAGIAFALWLGGTWPRKLIWASVVLALFLAPVAPEIYQRFEYQQRLTKATKLFEERCKTAGEKIYKTIEDVDGVLLMKVRPEKINFADQYLMDDPFGADCHGQSCIAGLLRAAQGGESSVKSGSEERAGFNWIDAVDPNDALLYRYVGVTKFHPSGDSYLAIEKNKIAASDARFGVTYDDISATKDRDLWIAGGSLKIVDLATQAVIAERIGFMMDRGQGNTDGGRQPWSFAQQNACPEFPTIGGSDARRRRSSQINRNFIESVLKPSQGK